MRARSFAWLMTAVSVAMVIVISARINRGWPAGPKTYTFIVATLLVIIIAIVAWRRANADQRTVEARSEPQ